MIEDANRYESLLKDYYKTCNHQCDNCPFADECESDKSGMLE